MRTLTGAIGTSVAVGGVVILLAGVAVAGIPSTTTGEITACVNKKTTITRIIDAQAGKRCTRKEQTVTWAQRGPRGAVGLAGTKGAAGAVGQAGSTGAQGATGQAGATGPQGPAGAKGDTGPRGPVGEPGNHSRLQGQVTVTLAPDSQWHDVARIEVRAGTWDVGFTTNITRRNIDSVAEGFPGGTSYSGQNECKVTVGGVTNSLDNNSNGSWTHYLWLERLVIQEGASAVWSCRNSITHASAGPAAIEMHITVDQQSPEQILPATAL